MLNLPTVRWGHLHRVGVGVLLVVLTAPAVWASPNESEPRWDQLSATERQILNPLQREWASIEPARKLKWRELASRFPQLSPERQALLRSRMNAWAEMGPSERAAARLRYQEAKRLPDDERRARWERYQALPEGQRRALADQAQRREQQPGTKTQQARTNRLDDVQPKTSVAPAGNSFGPNRMVAPGTVSATVGASTRPINERPAPPLHLQAGLPKIAATPGFVDSNTLLPQRGPQGAASLRGTDAERTRP